jgi:hypothetical protein
MLGSIVETAFLTARSKFRADITGNNVDLGFGAAELAFLVEINVEIALPTALCRCSTRAVGEYGGLGLGVVMLPALVGEVGACSGKGERKARFGSGEEGVGLVEPGVYVSCVVYLQQSQVTHHVSTTYFVPQHMKAAAPHLQLWHRYQLCLLLQAG